MKWISVKEKPPEGHCLVWLTEKHVTGHIHPASFGGNIEMIGSHFIWDMKHNPITHWMPMIEGPE